MWARWARLRRKVIGTGSRAVGRWRRPDSAPLRATRNVRTICSGVMPARIAFSRSIRISAWSEASSTYQSTSTTPSVVGRSHGSATIGQC